MACGIDEYKRFKMIDEYFASGKKATVKELAEYFYKKKYESNFDLACGLSEKILYKVLSAMKKELFVPLQKDSENRYYYSSQRTLTKPGYLSRSETAKTIRHIGKLLETIKDTPIYDEASKLCQEITDEAPLINSFGKKIQDDEEEISAANRVVFLGAPASIVKDEIWADIYKAMENNLHIGIKYIASGKSTVTRHGVRPYQLIFDDGIWDLWGYDCLKKQNHLYNLSRIQSVEIKKDSFKLPDDFDFHKVTPGTFGCYRDTQSNDMTFYKIRLAKKSYAENFARERVWGKNYKV